MRKKADAVPEGEDLRDLSARARITLLVVIAALPSFILIVVAAVWKQISYNFLFFLAGLQSIPRSLIEAAANVVPVAKIVPETPSDVRV